MRRAARRLAAALLASALTACAGPSVDRPALQHLSLVGVATIPHRAPFEGTVVGGLSGIDYDPATGRFVAISDDRRGGRAYELTLPISPDAVGPVTLTRVIALSDRDGQPFPPDGIDPEAIRWTGDGLTWTSEGDAARGIGAAAFRAGRDGRTLAVMEPPAAYRPAPQGAPPHGVRNNLAFEGLALSADGATLYTATENALAQDGPVATAGVGSPCRILRLDAATGRVTGEFVYVTEPIPAVGVPPRIGADNGVAELLTLDDANLLVLERAYIPGFGNVIRLFVADLAGATDVADRPALAGTDYVPAAKRLVADLGTLGFKPDNIEGMTFGPPLPDGARTLVLVSDDNFNPGQTTQLVVLRVGRPGG